MTMKFRAKVLRVVDGDTIEVLLDLGCDQFSREKVRLQGIDVWESRHKDPIHKSKGKFAAEFVRIELDNYYLDSDALEGDWVTVTSHKYKRGKFGRLLGDIEYINPNGELASLRDALRAAGYEKDE